MGASLNTAQRDRFDRFFDGHYEAMVAEIADSDILDRVAVVFDLAPEPVGGRDEFVLRLVLDNRTQVDDVTDELVTKRQRRPVTQAVLLDQLAVALPRAIARLRSTD